MTLTTDQLTSAEVRALAVATLHWSRERQRDLTALDREIIDRRLLELVVRLGEMVEERTMPITERTTPLTELAKMYDDAARYEAERSARSPLSHLMREKRASQLDHEAAVESARRVARERSATSMADRMREQHP